MYAGLRPLLGSAADDTTKLSREHAVRRSAPGLVSVAGGKYTTYRLMAEDAVDAVSRDLPFPVDASRTATIPLLGAAGLPGARYRLNVHPGARDLGAGTARPPAAALRHPRRRRPRPGGRGAGPGGAAPGAEQYVSAEAIYATLHEGALHIDDVLTRRTHIAFEAADRGREAAAHVAALMAPVLGWDQTAVGREVATTTRGSPRSAPLSRCSTTPRPIRHALRYGTCGCWPSESAE